MEEIFGVAKNFEDLISFHDNSIVSKVLMKNKGGNITLFALSQGQEISEHMTPFDVLVFCINGEGLIYVNKKENLLSAGDFILLPANQSHSVVAKTNFIMLLAMLKDF